MNKNKKEPCIDGTFTNSLRRTITNLPSTSRGRSEGQQSANDVHSRTSSSKSTDSSPERKLQKTGRPVARGSETGIIFDRNELQKLSITIKQKVVPVKPPTVEITNPETITPVRRPDEGAHPIFGKSGLKETSQNYKEREATKINFPIDSSRSKEGSSREYSSEHRRGKNRSRSRDKRRRYSPESRRSYSSDSSSSGDERRRRRYYRAKFERDRLERQRRDYDREHLSRRERRPPEQGSSSKHSNGDSPERKSRLKEKEDNLGEKKNVERMEDENNGGVMRPRYPPRMPPPYMLRPPPMRPIMPLPHFPPPYLPVRFYPGPPMPPFRGPPRPMMPPRGFYRS